MVENLESINSILREYNSLISFTIAIGIGSLLRGLIEKIVRYFFEGYSSHISRKISELDEKKAISEKIRKIESAIPVGEKVFENLAEEIYKRHEIALYQRLYEIEGYSRRIFVATILLTASTASLLFFMVYPGLMEGATLLLLIFISAGIAMCDYLKNRGKAKILYYKNNSV